jgi:hypothetical protein
MFEKIGEIKGFGYTSYRIRWLQSGYEETVTSQWYDHYTAICSVCDHYERDHRGTQCVVCARVCGLPGAKVTTNEQAPNDNETSNTI